MLVTFEVVSDRRLWFLDWLASARVRIQIHRCNAESITDALTFLFVDAEILRRTILGCERTPGLRQWLWLMRWASDAPVNDFVALIVVIFGLA